MKKVYFLALALAMIVTAGLTPACGGGSEGDQGTELSVNANESSLAQIWEAVVEDAGFQESTASLEELMVWYRGAGTVYLMQYTFSATGAEGTVKTVTVNSDNDGKVACWLVETGGVPTDTLPRDVFEELDSVSPEKILRGEYEAHVDMNFMVGPMRYDGSATCDGGPCRLYELKDGVLMPLKSVLFAAEQPCSDISVVRFAQGAQTPSSSEIWFLTSDLDKAESVVYA